jgi:hypothetical protein
MSNPFFTSRKAALEEEESSRGVLDNSQRYLDAIDSMPYQTPRFNDDGTVNQQDLYRMQQTMIPVEGQPNQFMLPERADAIARIQQAQQMAALAQDKFQRNNATMSDVFAEAGNTLFGPLNVLAGGSMKPFGDPSEDQLSRSQRATLAASNTAREAYNELRKARVDRSSAVSGALTKPIGTRFKGPDGTMKLAVQKADGSLDTIDLPNSEYADDVITFQGTPYSVTRGAGGMIGVAPVLSNEQAQGAGTQTGLAKVAETEAQADAQAVYDAPSAVEQFERNIAEVNSLIDRADRFTGANDMNLIAKMQPGTEHYDFVAAVDKVKGNVFLEAFQGLKGGGPITDTEGKAATQARAQLDTGQSPQQFKAQAEAYRQILLKGLDKALRDASRDIKTLDAFERQREVQKLRGDLNMGPGESR